MTLWKRTWKSSDAAAAVGMDLGKFKLWISRGYPVAEGMEGGGSQGRHRLFSFRNIMEFAVAKAFIDQGIAPGAAFAAAATFAYSAVNPDTRLPGLPLHPDDGDTIVALAGETSVSSHMPASRAEWADFKGELANGGNDFGLEGAAIVFVNAVFRNVCIRLGFDPIETLDEIYQRGPFAKRIPRGER